MTILYSVLHLLVDSVCALAMFGSFLSGDKGYYHILVYNFCAFALQMPVGAFLDILSSFDSGGENSKKNKEEQRKKKIQWDPAVLTASAGALFTVLGAFTHPAVLGIGNALFHVGGGVGCIREDRARNWHGRGLGMFVAPGALGLYLGTLIAKGGSWKIWVWGIGALMIFLCLGLLYGLKLRDGLWVKQSKSGDRKVLQQKNGYGKLEQQGSRHYGNGNKESNGRRLIWGKTAAALLCLAVVVLRSYIGMSVSFSWKTGIPAGILAVLALVAGKVAGGFAGARCGFRKTAVVSLLLAGIFYLFSSCMPMGLAALFFFNMTMPITLYWMVCSFPQMPGFAFGFLTFALFLGFLPEYFGWQMMADGKLIGSMGSLLSLLLLLAGLGKGGGCEELSD